MRFAIIVSKFNETVTHGLLSGAKKYLVEKDISPQSIETFSAPGAFEIPLIAKELARTNRFDGIICLGCVIKGESAHFEFISLAATIGILNTTLKERVPISFGILTTYTDDQATARSSDNSENKGREAAAACLETVETLKAIRLYD